MNFFYDVNKFKKQLAHYKQNRSKYLGIKPTVDEAWCIRERDVVACLKKAVLIRDGLIW
jgi:hypothetical protein